MGGMAALEWPLVFPEYTRNIIPIATSARHSAWCISWGEAERQSIYSDPAYQDGYYDAIVGQPKAGLAAARMAALLTYRSRDSFESRFGRKPQPANGVGRSGRSQTASSGVMTPPASPPTPGATALAAHNDGHRSSGAPSPRARENATPTTPFSAQSYLRYQGDKFTSRFDANCYIHITRKMDTHDVTRGRVSLEDEGPNGVATVLSTIKQNTLVISIETDGLFTPSEQHEIAASIEGAKLVTIPSPDGHDGFLLEFEQINRHILAFLHEHVPELYEGPQTVVEGGDFDIKKTSMFGEAEADIARW
jgi:homoserine O-acetyltransferase/O-succinyltransferase